MTAHEKEAVRYLQTLAQYLKAMGFTLKQWDHLEFDDQLGYEERASFEEAFNVVTLTVYSRIGANVWNRLA